MSEQNQTEQPDYDAIYQAATASLTDLDDTLEDAEESIFAQAYRIAIILAYQTKGWVGKIEENGDVYLAHEEHGHAFFDEVSAYANRTEYRSYWCRDDGRVPDLRHDTWRRVESRDQSPKEFCIEMMRNILSEPMYGPEFFKEDYEKDADFEEPDYADELHEEGVQIDADGNEVADHEDVYGDIELDEVEFAGAVSATTGLSIEDAEDSEGGESLIG